MVVFAFRGWRAGRLSSAAWRRSWAGRGGDAKQVVTGHAEISGKAGHVSNQGEARIFSHKNFAIVDFRCFGGATAALQVRNLENQTIRVTYQDGGQRLSQPGQVRRHRAHRLHRPRRRDHRPQPQVRHAERRLGPAGRRLLRLRGPHHPAPPRRDAPERVGRSAGSDRGPPRVGAGGADYSAQVYV